MPKVLMTVAACIATDPSAARQVGTVRATIKRSDPIGQSARGISCSDKMGLNYCFRVGGETVVSKGRHKCCMAKVKVFVTMQCYKVLPTITVITVDDRDGRLGVVNRCFVAGMVGMVAVLDENRKRSLRQPNGTQNRDMASGSKEILSGPRDSLTKASIRRETSPNVTTKIIKAASRRPMGPIVNEVMSVLGDFSAMAPRRMRRRSQCLL